MPKDDEVLVSVRAAEATKSDCEMRSFNYSVKWFWLPLRIALGVRKPRRQILGGYFSGEIESLGKDVTTFSVGDQVFGTAGLRLGAYGDYVALPARYTIVPKPNNMSFAEAAAVPLGGLNALHFMRRANIRLGEPIKGGATERIVLKFSRHGPVFYEDLDNRRAYAVRSVVQERGTAAYKGSFQLAQANSCADFFDRAMHWLVPTHSLICGDVDGNIALQVTGLTLDREGWNGRLPVPGTGEYEWRGFRTDLPREFNPERGYIATANNNVHPPGYQGRPVFYHSSRGVETSRITRLHQILGSGERLSVDDHMRIQHDVYSLAAEGDIPAFQGWTSDDVDVEWARNLIAEWDATLSKESTAAALHVRWRAEADERALDEATPLAERHGLVEQGLKLTLERLTDELGPDRTEWRHGRLHASKLPHMTVSAFDLPSVERPGGVGTANATGANFRRVIDLSDLDLSVASNSPGQSAQPGSPFYDNLVENLGNGEYFPLLYTRSAVEKRAAHRLTLKPVDH